MIKRKMTSNLHSSEKKKHFFLLICSMIGFLHYPLSMKIIQRLVIVILIMISESLKYSTGSPHFTWFHFARSSLYTKFVFLPNGFTLCNALQDFLTLYYQKTLSLVLKVLCFTLHFTKIV